MLSRGLAWALVAAGGMVLAFGLVRASAAAACVGEAARCEPLGYWLAVIFVGAALAFVGLGSIVASRRRSRIL